MNIINKVPVAASALVAMSLLAPGALALSSPVSAAAASVAELKGSAEGYRARVFYDSAKHTINKVTLEFTCDGKPAVAETDLHRVALGSVTRKLVKPDGRGRFHVSKRAIHTRFNEGLADERFPQPPATVTLKATLAKIGKRLSITGTFTVAAKHCTPPSGHFHVSGKLTS